MERRTACAWLVDGGRRIWQDIYMMDDGDEELSGIRRIRL